jgi:hypothetical protein
MRQRHPPTHPPEPLHAYPPRTPLRTVPTTHFPPRTHPSAHTPAQSAPRAPNSKGRQGQSLTRNAEVRPPTAGRMRMVHACMKAGERLLAEGGHIACEHGILLVDLHGLPHGPRALVHAGTYTARQRRHESAHWPAIRAGTGHGAQRGGGNAQRMRLPVASFRAPRRTCRAEAARCLVGRELALRSRTA